VKIGAYFRAEYSWGNTGASLTNLDVSGADGQRRRISGTEYNPRARAFILMDTRQQTAYGTLRAYLNIGWSNDIPGQVGTSRVTATGGHATGALYAHPSFIQLAGFTWGVATSYYDFFSSPATSYTVPASSDT